MRLLGKYIVEFNGHQEHINKRLANTIQVIIIKVYINFVSVTGSNSLGFDLKIRGFVL